MEKHEMTVAELYNFAEKHGFEDAVIWIPTGSNTKASIAYAKLEIQSCEEDRDKKRVYLVYNS